ncbi:MAG: sensor histidine kinase [Oscillospiraceae bacterium]|nr:sensor histidine kinase [Oscillospiraceae bacterium]
MKLWFFLCAKALLLSFGLWQASQFPEQDHLILCLFLVLDLSFSALLLRKKLWQTVCLVLGGLLAFLFPAAIAFLPFFLFDAVLLKRYPASLPGLFALLYLPLDMPLRLIVAGGALTAALLAYALKENTDLRKAVSRVKDEADEKAIANRAEQKARSEKQDAEVYAATLAERNRIAREIHDNVGHMLSRSILLTGALKTVRKEDAALESQLVVLEQTLHEAMDAIRESVHDLYEDSIDLEQAAGALAAEFRFCPVTLSCRISSAVPRNISYCLLAVMKEALVNIQKHSTATAAHIAITEHPALWQMSIEDNGRTAPARTGDDSPADPFSAQNGLGLNNMRHRVEQLSGTIHFSAKNGFRIFLTIPKEAL